MQYLTWGEVINLEITRSVLSYLHNLQQEHLCQVYLIYKSWWKPNKETKQKMHSITDCSLYTNFKYLSKWMKEDSWIHDPISWILVGTDPGVSYKLATESVVREMKARTYWGAARGFSPLTAMFCTTARGVPPSHGTQNFLKEIYYQTSSEKIILGAAVCKVW